MSDKDKKINEDITEVSDKNIPENIPENVTENVTENTDKTTEEKSEKARKLNEVGIEIYDVPEETTDSEVENLIGYLIELVLRNDKYDLSKIEAAYRFAKSAHEGQKRSTGQPYITHPLQVAIVLIKELGMDTDTVCAGLLHDVIEDTQYSFKDVKNRFGQDVAMLVDGVTKIAKVPLLTSDEIKGESVKKLLLAMSHDIRVLIVKLADRLHNMRTLKFCAEHKQRRVALETMYVYANLADRLGMFSVKEELEDLAFRYLDPYAYVEIEEMLELNKFQREKFIDDTKNALEEMFGKVHMHFIRAPYVEGRVKSIYGIYKKAYKQGKSIEEIYDRYAVRVIVTTQEECYNVLGMIHDRYTPMPNRFKDYIALSKQNGYQSLHTTVLSKTVGLPFEVQIRTWKMHETAEYGIAAHWKYKEGIVGKDKMEDRLSWIRQALELQQTNESSEELIDFIKNDYGDEDIVVLTPQGDALTLPLGSTALDFAYRIHTEVGHKTIGVKVDKKIESLDYILKTGQLVEIITGKVPLPKKGWLDIVKTNEAKTKIRAWFKRECRPENIVAGKEKLRREFIKYKMQIPETELEKFLLNDMRKHSCANLEDFYATIGYGGIVLENLMPRLRDEYTKQYTDLMAYYDGKLREVNKPESKQQSAVILEDISTLQTKFAKCCNPLPGDKIVGFITRGGYISVHKEDCENYQLALETGENLERWHKVDWSNTKKINHETKIEIIALDRVGLNLDITMVLADAKINIINSSSRNIKDGRAVFEALLYITDLEQLDILLKKLSQIRDVISVNRR